MISSEELIYCCCVFLALLFLIFGNRLRQDGYHLLMNKILIYIFAIVEGDWNNCNANEQSKCCSSERMLHLKP